MGRVGHLDSVRNSEALRAAHNAMLPEVTQFFSRIPLNTALWKRIKAYAETAEAKSLTGVRKRFLDETVKDFMRSGADLPEDEKTRLEEVQSELARITQKFSENVLDSTNAWELVLEDDSRLGGLPETALGVLSAPKPRRRARERGKTCLPHHPEGTRLFSGSRIRRRRGPARGSLARQHHRGPQR